MKSDYKDGKILVCVYACPRMCNKLSDEKDKSSLGQSVADETGPIKAFRGTK